MEQNEFYKQLVSRYADNTATNDELQIFFQLLKEGKLDEFLSDKMQEDANSIEVKEIAPIRRIPVWIKVAVAAMLILFAGMFLLNQNNSGKGEIVVKEKTALPVNDVAPGGNKATLTLANGTKIILDSAQNGTLTQQGNIKIIKLDDGQLAYDKSGLENNEILYNTISTPRGGQYQMTLSDGTKVWLNAESSLRFPASFTGKERKVELTGEGYFEVAHNAEKPFHVSVNGANVQVLGTHFNVNAYKDEEVMKTTLLEGSVEVSKGNESVKIIPGDQAIVTKAEKITIKKGIDLESVVAWKNGIFYFNEADIPNIMKKISRWYDLDYEIKGDVSNKKFNGKIFRNVNVSQVLRILEEGGMHIDLIGKKVIISK